MNDMSFKGAKTYKVHRSSGAPVLDQTYDPIDFPLDASIADTAPVVDVTIKLTPALQALIDRNGFENGKKYTLTEKEYEEVMAEVFRETNDDGTPRDPPTLTPGGTGANFAAGLFALLGDAVQSIFLGIVPSKDGAMEEIARKSLDDYHIRSFRHENAKDLPALTNFAVQMPGGDRIVLKAPLARHAAALDRVLFENGEFHGEFMKSRLLFLADNVRIRARNFDDQVLCDRWTREQILCYSGPTDEKFALENSDHIRWILESVNVALLNTDELRAAYHIDKPVIPEGASPEETEFLHNASICQALDELQQSFRQGPLSNRKNFREQVGFITDGEFGAYIVTADGWQHFPALKLDKKDIVNKVGAGDISFASFVAAYLMGCPLRQCVEIAQTVAATKIGVNSARLPDAYERLAAQHSDLAAPFASLHPTVAGSPRPNGPSVGATIH